MCGIAGFCLEPGHPFDANLLANILLGGIEERGGDATGCAWWGPNALVMDKAPVTASRFRVRMSSRTETAILHTRLATQGSPKRNRNNHPVPCGERGKRIVGVHNGVIWNDDQLFKDVLKRERHAEVDSEAVMAYLYEAGPDVDNMEAVIGSYALAYLNEQEPGVLYLRRGADSPLVVARCEWGWVFASTWSCLNRVEKLVGGWGKGGDPQRYTEGKLGVYNSGVELSYTDFKFEDMTWGKGYGRFGHSTGSLARQRLAYSTDYAGSVEGWGWEDQSVLTDEELERARRKYDMKLTGWDSRVRVGSQWMSSIRDPEDPLHKTFIHYYDDGSYVKNENEVPPFKYCTTLGQSPSPVLLEAGEGCTAEEDYPVDTLVRVEDPSDPEGWVWCSDCGSWGGLNWCNCTKTHGKKLSTDEELARKEAGNVMQLMKRGGR